MTKKLIEEIETLEVCEFVGTLQNLRNKIKDLIDEGWVNIYVDEFSDSDAFEISKLRLETDEEYDAHIKFENEQSERLAKNNKMIEKRERETLDEDARVSAIGNAFKAAEATIGYDYVYETCEAAPTFTSAHATFELIASHKLESLKFLPLFLNL